MSVYKHFSAFSLNSGARAEEDQYGVQRDKHAQMTTHWILTGSFFSVDSR
jgi:hypothetical protein